MIRVSNYMSCFDINYNWRWGDIYADWRWRTELRAERNILRNILGNGDSGNPWWLWSRSTFVEEILHWSAQRNPLAEVTSLWIKLHFPALSCPSTPSWLDSKCPQKWKLDCYKIVECSVGIKSALDLQDVYSDTLGVTSHLRQPQERIRKSSAPGHQARHHCLITPHQRMKHWTTSSLLK